MQKLVYEKAWDKTISNQDREEIELVFQKSLAQVKENEIQFTTVWIAENYRGDLLVTALIHNPINDPFVIENKSLTFIDGQQVIGEHTFSVPSIVKGKTTLPWTFIFPKESYVLSDYVENGKLIMTKGVRKS